jgi:hypothetical protein
METIPTTLVANKFAEAEFEIKCGRLVAHIAVTWNTKRSTNLAITKFFRQENLASLNILVGGQIGSCGFLGAGLV